MRNICDAFTHRALGGYRTKVDTENDTTVAATAMHLCRLWSRMTSPHSQRRCYTTASRVALVPSDRALTTPGIAAPPLPVFYNTGARRCHLPHPAEYPLTLHCNAETRGWSLDRVQIHAGHSIAFNMFLHFVTLWPWPWPSDLILNGSPATPGLLMGR